MKYNMMNMFKLLTLYFYNRYIYRNFVKFKKFVYNCFYNNKYNKNIITDVRIIDIKTMTSTLIYKRCWIFTYILDVFACFGIYNDFKITSIKLSNKNKFIFFTYLNSKRNIIYDSTTNPKDFKFVYIDFPIKIDITQFFRIHKNIIYDNNLCVDELTRLLYITNYIDEKKYCKFYSNITKLILLDESFNEIKLCNEDKLYIH